MPKTKKLDKNKLREKARQRRLAAEKKRELEEIYDHPNFGDIHSSVGEALTGLIRNHGDLSNITNPDNFSNHLLTLMRYLITPYLTRQFSLSQVKRGIEIWLHRKVKRSEISLLEAGIYIGILVEENKILDIDCSTLPWCPKHPAGHIAWKGVLDLAGVINNEDVDLEARISVINEMRDFEGYVKFLADLRVDKKYEIDSSYNIEPGTILDLSD